ncbi:MAG: hypothetical protein PVSMB7_26930 [Chloroflexota bacterium]
MRDGSNDAIVLNGVNRVYGSKALRNVSLHVPVSSLYGIYGAANAGKTTLLRLIVGLERADSGVIRVSGLDAWHDRAVLRYRLAFMPTKFGDFPHVTVDEYLSFFEASFDIARNQRAPLKSDHPGASLVLVSIA